MALIGSAWVDAVTRLGGDRAAATASAAELERRYAEPHRAYHVAAHVEAVLRDAASLADATGLDDASATVVELAACAHDVVYDLRPGDDERASAAWASEHLAVAGVDGSLGARVADLVLATASHCAGADARAAAVLLDADLAILASTPRAYSAYVAAVRREYRAVPDDQWRTGRTRVLSALVERPRLYVTEEAHNRWEDAARRNVAAELAGLAG